MTSSKPNTQTVLLTKPQADVDVDAVFGTAPTDVVEYEFLAPECAMLSGDFGTWP